MFAEVAETCTHNNGIPETVGSKLKTPRIPESLKQNVSNRHLRRKNRFNTFLPADDHTLISTESRNHHMQTRLYKLLMTPVISLRTRTVLRDGSGATVKKAVKRLLDKIQVMGTQKKKGKFNKVRRTTYGELLNPRKESKKQQETGYKISKSTTNNESGMPHIEIQQRSSFTPSSTASTQFLCKEDVQLLEKIADADENSTDVSLRASYRVAHIIARTGTPLSMGPLVKSCLLTVIECLAPADITKFEGVCLSKQTISRWIRDMGADLENQLKQKCQTFIAFSLALDKTTDVTDIAQLAIFVRGVNSELDVFEELLDVIPMEYTTTGNDIFEVVSESEENICLPWDRLCSVATDGAPQMAGSQQGFVTRLKEKLKTEFHKEISSIHCFVHQEALCGESVKCSDVMKVVVKCVNFVRRHGVNHRQFKDFLHDLEAAYGDIPYHCTVRWLSRGKVLDVFFAIREEIALFMEMKGETQPSLTEKKWIADLAYLTDIMGHLNSLNTTLQGKDLLIVDMCDKINAFMDKLHLFERQLGTGDLTFFECFSSLQLPEDTRFGDYQQILVQPCQSFEAEFQDIRSLQNVFKLFSTPFSIVPDTVPSEM